jgi:hypothetical protein
MEGAMMTESLRRQIRGNLNQKGTEELLEIWIKHDLGEWSEVTYDIIREILEERHVDLPAQEAAGKRKLSAEVDQITDVGELEKKIKESETALINAKSQAFAGWVPLIGSLGILITMAIKVLNSEIYLVITLAALLYVAFNIWRLYHADQQKKEAEARLEQYRQKLAELQA